MSADQDGIILVPYDPGWPAAFEAEAIHLRTALGALALRLIITVRQRFRDSVPNRLSTSRCQSPRFSRSRGTVSALRPLDTLTFLIPTIRSVHSSIGRFNGHTATMCTLSSEAGVKSGARWPFATIFATIPTWLVNTNI